MVVGIDAGSWCGGEMQVVYRAPEGTLLFDPSPARLADILLTTGQDYWLQGGNGEATLDVIREPGESVASHRTMTTPDGATVEYVAGQPSLWIKQPEPGWYFVT